MTDSVDLFSGDQVKAAILGKCHKQSLSFFHSLNSSLSFFFFFFFFSFFGGGWAAGGRRSRRREEKRLAFNRIQTPKRFRITLFIRTKHNMRKTINNEMES